MEENMKTRLIILGVLLAMFMILYASDDPSETTRDDQKKQELDQLAQRFKAETGFEGEIETIPSAMRLGVIKGNFHSVQITATLDTLEIRKAFDSVITTILPFIRAPREQLSLTAIYKRDIGFTTDYIQLINGYKLQGVGFIRITMNQKLRKFKLTDSTVIAKANQVNDVITPDKAKRIALEDYISGAPYPKAYPVDTIAPMPGYGLVYSNRYTEEFTLVYIITLNNSSYSYYIDAGTGEIIYREPQISIPLIGQISVTGNKYLQGSYGLNNLPSEAVGCYGMEDVQISLPNYLGQTDSEGNVICDTDDICDLYAILKATEIGNFFISHESSPDISISTSEPAKWQ